MGTDWEHAGRTNASVETVNQATEVRLLAERQMGAFLKAMPKAKGAMGIGTSGVTSSNPTLSQIGITNMQSHRSQKLAAIPEPEFQERVEAAKSTGKLTTAAVVAPVR